MLYEAEAYQLVEEKTIIAAENEKDKEEVVQLRWELQNLWAGFATQKEDLEADYQKQVDDIFFYGYRCCMKKHDIAHYTPNFPSDDEDEFLGCLAQGDETFVKGDSPGEWA